MTQNPRGAGAPYPQGGPQPQVVYVQQPPKKKGKGCLTALLVIVGLIVIGAVINALGGGGDKSADPASSANEPTSASSAGENKTEGKETKKEAPKAEKKAEEQPVPANKLGVPVKSGDLEFTASGYKCGVTVNDVAGQPVEPQGQFCKLDFTVKNVGKEQQTVMDDQIKLIGADGVEYGTSSDTMLVDGVIFLKQVNPGNSIKGTAYFDIPKDAKPQKVSVKAGLFSKAQEIALS